MLTAINLRQSYHKPEDDIAGDFYLPCLAASETYDRAVGFFSSAIYVLAWTSLKEFVHNGGRMRLICSPALTSADTDAMFEGYSQRAEADQSELVVSTFRQMVSSPVSVRPAKVLAALVAMGVIDIKIAWVTDAAGARTKRLFHDKLGIFTDAAGATVVFKGSMNETWSGLSLDGNLESVDVYTSWAGTAESERVETEKEYFERLWRSEFAGVEVKPLPDLARQELEANADAEQWEAIVDEICEEISFADRWAPGRSSDPRKPRAHQVAALNAWEAADRRGILKHATGSGKTFTALCAIADSIKRNEVPLVLVPSELLLEQWKIELISMFDQSVGILVCGGGSDSWKDDRLLRAWTRRPRSGPSRIVLSTIQTAVSENFLSQLDEGDHLFMVADEVHRLGAHQAQRLLKVDTGPKLGLSATPERAGDPSGTQAIFDYFHGIVPPPFTLQDAIAAGALTPYSYQIHTIALTTDEQDRWAASTARIRQLYARMQANPSERADRTFKLELIRRSKIAKSAERKVPKAVEIVASNYKDGQRWIVYCDDQNQLAAVKSEISERVGDKVYEYHSAMQGDRRSTLSVFERYGGIVVSIKCLDEGVDIPAVDTALILASSRNPREYIQRRGRVLRKSAGKSVAVIHDVLVTPPGEHEESEDTAILEGEIARAINFGKSALNPGCIAELERIAATYGIEITDLDESGIEDD